MYEHDQGGRLVRATTTREAEWTELDQAEMLALAEYRSSLCPLHGGPLEECQTGERDGGPVFEAHGIRCRVRFEQLLVQAGDERMKEHPESMLWTSVKTKGA